MEINAGTDLAGFDYTKSNFLYVFDTPPMLSLCPNHVETLLSGKTSFDHIYDYAKNENPDLFFIFEDYINYENKNNLNFICLNSFFINDVRTFVDNQHIFEKPRLTTKTIDKNFLFLSNKIRPHRALTSCWIKNFANDLNFNYTSLSIPPYMLEELLLNNSFELDTTKALEPNFLFTDTCTFDNNDNFVDYGYVSGNSAGDPNFNNFLNIRALYDNTALSLITESIFYEKSFQLSEKTLHAYLSGHMVIWPAGWECARAVKDLGFDVFDDILDHSYQYIDNPVNRTLQALELNKNVIFDKSLQQKFYNDNIERFQHNIDLCFSIDTLIDNSLKINDPLLLQKFINTCSNPSKTLINEYREKFNFPKNNI